MNRKHENDVSRMKGFVGGLLVGGLVGAGAMLLWAPQSGEKTRAVIQQKSMEVRDQVVKTVEDTAAQVRSKALEITDNVQEQAEALGQRGKDVVDEQRDNLGQTLKDLGKAVKS